MVYILALVGMVCWGISPIFAKLGLKDVNPLVGLSIRTIFTAIVVTVWIILNGSVGEIKAIPGRSILLLLIEAALATVIGDLAYFAALKQGSASIVMLIMACSPLVTILCSVFFLSEKMTIPNIIGAFLIIVGIGLLV